MKRSLLRGFAVALFGLLLFDVVLDATASHADSPGAEVCHSCACGPHLDSGRSESITADIPERPFAQRVETLYSLILPSAVFHPPKLTA